MNEKPIQTDNKEKRWPGIQRKILWTALILLSVLATVKVCFLSLGVDEEYAVTMSYRIAAGDQMFQEMWEPHQTSGFLSALLIKLYLCCTGKTDYLILYLRICGCILQFLISVFLYRTAKKVFRRDICFVAAVFFYNTLPKWIQTPEFSNMLIWFSVLAFLCFLNYYFPAGKAGDPGRETGSPAWLIGAGISVSCMVLSYPSCVLSVPFYGIAMWMIRKREKREFRVFLREILFFAGTCIVLGLLYIGFFLSRMSLGDFLYGVSQMMTDGSHSSSLGDKAIAWGGELLELSRHVLFTLVLALIALACIRRLRKWNRFLIIWLCISLAEQVLIWFGDSHYLHRPLLYFYILLFSGCLVYHFYFRKEKPRSAVFLLWMGIVTGAATWFGALLITNTTISVTGPYLMTGLLGALFLIDESFFAGSAGDQAGKYVLLTLLTLCLTGTVLLEKGYFVCSNEGVKDTAAMTRQKVLYGPAKGIYCRYLEGYVLNTYAELLGQVQAERRRVLYVGMHSLVYFYGDQIICNYSTISTPTYDERLLEYWEKNPDRYPELVICDVSDEQVEQISRLIPLGNLLISEKYMDDLPEIRIYETEDPPEKEDMTAADD